MQRVSTTQKAFLGALLDGPRSVQQLVEDLNKPLNAVQGIRTACRRRGWIDDGKVIGDPIFITDAGRAALASL
jgi:hypothetical protein